MKKVFNIYDISSGDGVYVQTVTKEISARPICRQHNKNGERNYMYLQSYEQGTSSTAHGTAYHCPAQAGGYQPAGTR